MNESPDETPSEVQNVISKKDLLRETGISYGQLYRWKREGLIPEEWFDKRSAYTGQETFFPRKLVLERLEAIQSMKEGLSLSEIREQLSAQPLQANLQHVLHAIGGMEEGFINDLLTASNNLWLSELSARAISTLYLALDKTGASSKENYDLVAQAIRALGVAVPCSTSADSTTAEEKG
ncbi:MAG: YhbD family protein [Coriobacteriales bacterium]|jgi:DNA-binding transcriptional MerR regulator|nr:YhbD family protein [Coriobacteriales bacterium]